jgi:hypothetical protein
MIITMGTLTDTLKIAVKDTGLVAQSSSYCSNPGHCKNHPLKNPEAEVSFISPLTINFNEALQGGSLTDSSQMDTVAHNKKELHTFANQDTHAINTNHVSPKNKEQMLSIESIKPGDDKLLKNADTRAPQEIISIVPQKKSIDDFTELKYEPMAQAMLISFMVYVTALYVVRSSSHWAGLAMEIKQVYSA